MDLVGNYGSGSDEEQEVKTAQQVKAEEAARAKKRAMIVAMKGKMVKKSVVNAAPLVAIDLKAGQSFVNSLETKELTHNPTVTELWQPIAGPHNPNNETTLGAAQGVQMNGVTGFVEKTHFDNYHFEEQYHTFMRHGYSMDPSEAADGGTGVRLVGDQDSINQTGGYTVTAVPKKAMSAEQKDLRKKRRALTGDVNDVDNFKGPWASYYFEEEQEMVEPNEEQKAWALQQDNKKKRKTTDDDEEEEMEESSEFHGTQLLDYQGRSYVSPPSTLKPYTDAKCYIPKKNIHTWYGHKKGVSKIEFFPKYGHIMLSASMDSTIKIWDVYNQRKCLRTFYGHTEAVRDINFNPDGTRFISVSYDRYVKLWDTETGQMISKHTDKKLPCCGKIYPDDDNQVLVGTMDKKVIQWDMRANEIVQTYDEHLGPVNSVLFMDNNKRFISTSDDKKVYMWEYGIPVVIKHIAEPEMHSMPFTEVHPSGKWWVGQSQDNKISVYGAIQKVKLNSKKHFKGHLTAGYACQIGFSPDGKYIFSGDAEGRVFFWDWRTQTIYKKLKAHDQVCIGAIWHPIETSRMATCSWDGTIKYWD